MHLDQWRQYSLHTWADGHFRYKTGSCKQHEVIQENEEAKTQNEDRHRETGHTVL
jgi:hypothetical protein